MCSICGMIDFNNRPNTVELLAMSHTMKSRGPDESGLKCGSFYAFAHNRLSVMDPESSKQPMTVEYQGLRYTIIYNGEVYNFRELRRELEDFGIRFRTDGDTEVVLYSYIIYGDKCPEKLNGIFAFAVVDEAKRRVFMARDRFGVKPFFYTSVGECLLIASEIKALLKHKAVRAQIDKTGLWQLLYLSPVTVAGSGVFRDIFEIKPAFCGFFSEKGLELWKYWELKAREISINRDEAIAETRRLLDDAIKRQLVSDVPLAVLLSGGLDSSVVSAVASKEYISRGDRLSTYSFEYEGNRQSFKSSLFQPQGDDEFAEWLAGELSTRHTVLTAPTELVADLLFDAVKARDIPGQADIDSSLLYFCSKIKEEHTVVLSGECADEIFGGYPWFYRKEMLESGFFPWIHSPRARIGLFRDESVKADEGYDYISGILRESIAECPVVEGESEEMRTSRIASYLSVNYFMTSLLERKDRMSMASGLEVRVPFSDHRILEFVYNVPWSIKFERSVEKALLREAYSDLLPDRIIHRKKSPYPKTHNPLYEKRVTEILRERLKSGGLLAELIDRERFDELMMGENTTWFGQLMSKPQLIAWLIQFDFWAEHYGVDII